MPLAARFLDIRRDSHSDELLVRGGDLDAHSVLQRAGFVAVVRVHETYHRAPAGLAQDEEIRLATEAVARLRSAGYHVVCDADFDTGSGRPVTCRWAPPSPTSPSGSAKPPPPTTRPAPSPKLTAATTASSPRWAESSPP